MVAIEEREQQRAMMRELARKIYLEALAESSVEKAFARHVDRERSVLRVCEDLYDLSAFQRVSVVSIGKAAHTMAESLASLAGSGFEGIIASSVQPVSQLHGFRYFRGGHPAPNAESVRAAEAILKTLEAQTQNSLVIFLLSGGGSSIVEKAIDDEITLEDLIATYEALVNSGAPIAEINAVRKHLSAVKGGRLARAAYPARQVTLMVSDVPDATPDAVASGPTMSDSTTVEDCYSIAQKYDLLERFPGSVAELFQSRALEETPKNDDDAFQFSRWWTISSNDSVVKAAAVAAAAAQAGFVVEIDNSCDDWDYQPAAEYLVNRLRQLRKQAPRACLISGGEVTVKVSNGGMGGRNQQFALCCAEKIAGEQMTILSAGTDGIDGNSEAAGAVVDGSTLERAVALGLNATVSLLQFDAFPFFQKLGDSVVTGPTGNNLRDLRILLAF